MTQKGRTILANGGNFNITKFALSDDEIDYTLWQGDHPLGSDSYGAILANMPLLEATPVETQTMRYKLVTLPKTTTRMPIVSVGFSSITLNGEGDTIIVTPTTRYSTGDTNGYTAVLSNSSYASLEVVQQVTGTVVPFIPVFLRDDELRQSITAVGNSFKLVGKNVSTFVSDVNVGFVETQLTLFGNNTGATATVTVRVNATAQALQTNTNTL